MHGQQNIKINVFYNASFHNSITDGLIFTKLSTGGPCTNTSISLKLYEDRRNISGTSYNACPYFVSKFPCSN